MHTPPFYRLIGLCEMHRCCYRCTYERVCPGVYGCRLVFEELKVQSGLFERSFLLLVKLVGVEDSMDVVGPCSAAHDDVEVVLLKHLEAVVREVALYTVEPDHHHVGRIPLRFPGHTLLEGERIGPYLMQPSFATRTPLPRPTRRAQACRSSPSGAARLVAFLLMGGGTPAAARALAGFQGGGVVFDFAVNAVSHPFKPICAFCEKEVTAIRILKHSRLRCYPLVDVIPSVVH
mmetsp:Transcript_22195/g.43166  ORF Transcript_22195/g.43166 Transcript_22195/m.43166 type:complete len:233 (-) Transcript_22195:588-1286(-)